MAYIESTKTKIREDYCFVQQQACMGASDQGATQTVTYTVTSSVPASGLERERVYAVRCHDGSLCTQKQPETNGLHAWAVQTKMLNQTAYASCA